MEKASLVDAVRERLPGRWSAVRLKVSRLEGVTLSHLERNETLDPGAEVLRQAQVLLDGDYKGRPFELEMQRADGRWKVELKAADEPEVLPAWNEESIKTWEAVCQERRQAYEKHFGPAPKTVQKLPTLMGFWPGGGMLQMPLEEGFLTITSGLSNFGLPTPVGVHEGYDAQGRRIPELRPRLRRLTPAGAAGYGYELAVITPEAETWPLLILGRLLEKEFLEDTDFLGKVHQFGSVTVDGLPLNERLGTHALISPADDPLPDSLTFSNGTCEFLTVTTITREELEYGLEFGAEALREEMEEAGMGQVSDLEGEPLEK